MGITLSHSSALHAHRTLRFSQTDWRSLNHAELSKAKPWVGKRWGKLQFTEKHWCWQVPSAACKLDVLVGNQRDRIRMQTVCNHVCSSALPNGSVLWLDEHANVVSPSLMFVQMAEIISLPALVLLGYELCGNYARTPDNPARGAVLDHIPAITSVGELQEYVDAVVGLTGITKARLALQYISDHALSAPEGLLATMYSLPIDELGYGLGPVILNERVLVAQDEDPLPGRSKHRYPDITLGIAPVGINYDGEGHIDFRGLVQAVRLADRLEGEKRLDAQLALAQKIRSIREKVVDDNRRDRELIVSGRIVFPITKEDLSDDYGLDELTKQILKTVKYYYGIDTTEYESAFANTDLTRDRKSLFEAMWTPGRADLSSRELW